MAFKTLQWVAVIALFAAFWVNWSSSSFGWHKPAWVDAAVLLIQVAFIVVIVVQMRRNRAAR